MVPAGFTAYALEEENHSHIDECYCPGGELVCALEETDEHSHEATCYCSGGELICELAEEEGHTHNEDCYADGGGGVLICGQEGPPASGIMPLDLVWDGSEILTEQDLLDAVTYASDGDTLKLGTDVTYDASVLGRITVDKHITLDFNGYILYSAGGTFQQSAGGWDDALFDIADTGSLTLVNAQIQTGTFNIVNGSRTSTWIGDFIGESKGAVTVQSTGQLGINAYNFIYENYGLVDIKTGTFRCEDFIDSSYEGSQIKVEDGTFYLESCFVDNTESTEIIIENCDITAGSYCFDDMYDTTFLFKNGSVKSDSSCFYVDSGGDSLITIENGSFESETGDVFYNYAEDASGFSKLIIYDGTFITHEEEVIYNYGEVEIYGGTFEAKNDHGYNEYSAIYTDGYEGFGTVTLYGGYFFTGDETPAFETSDGGTIVIAEGYHTEPAEWQTSDSVKVIPVVITITFHVEDSVVSTATDNPSNLVFPDDPSHSQGYEFCYWEKEDHTPVFDLSALRGDTDLYAVFSDRTYTVTFNDKGETSEETVIAGTPLGEVPGLDRAENGDLFSAWKLDGESVNSDTTIPVCSDLTLIAVYQRMVMNYDELLDALSQKEEVIVLGADIIVDDTIVVDYDCTITSDGKFGLIRPDDFLGVLLTTQTGVAGGEEIEGVTTSAFTLTLDNVLVDGRNIEADKPAVLVDERTTLVLKDSTIQNNINNASWWYDDQGGGICNKGTLKMYDGTIIRGNRAEKGGGVFNAEPESYRVNSESVYYPVIFYMYGGEISGNTALDNGTSCNAAGGGVNVDGRWDRHAEFFMYGGKITGNSAPNGCGGGVSLCCGDQPVFDTEDRGAQVVFTMYGGEITDNTTGESGGGVWVACSSFAMEGGLISRNTAAEDGGGISACCGCELNANITGGTITLNAAKNGGGIGTYIGGVIKPDAIYDNLASETGDDIVFENIGSSMVVLNRLPSRPYGESYESESTLSEMMQQLVQNAKKNLDVELLADYPEPTGVMIPFLGWFIDGNTRDSDVPRYDDVSDDKHDLSGEVLDWASVDNGNAVKAIWQGIVLLYDANYEGSTDYQYDPQGYLPGNDATVLENTFTRPGYIFIGWNTQADGLGTAYAAGDQILMEHSQVLYAQWEKGYTVTYVVSDDPIYGAPTDAIVPSDEYVYKYEDTVIVAPVLTTAWTTSDGTGNGIPGTWSFVPWDKESGFLITEDTVISGAWVFTPAPDKPEVPSNPATPDNSGTSHKPNDSTESIPQTGDSAHIGLWIALACLSLFGMIAAMFRRKRYSGNCSK